MLTGNETLQKINSELLEVLVDKTLALHKHLLAVENDTYAKVRVERRQIPKGCHLVECYANSHEYIIIGQPRSDDENHNCDEMGCSTVSHVIARFKKPATDVQAPQHVEIKEPVKPWKCGCLKPNCPNCWPVKPSSGANNENPA